MEVRREREGWDARAAGWRSCAGAEDTLLARPGHASNGASERTSASTNEATERRKNQVEKRSSHKTSLKRTADSHPPGCAQWPRPPRNSTRTARCGAPSRSAASPSAPPSGPITSAARSASRAPRARRTAPPTTWIGSAASIHACDSRARSPAPCSPLTQHLDAGRTQALRRPQVIPLSFPLPNFVSMSTFHGPSVSVRAERPSYCCCTNGSSVRPTTLALTAFSHVLFSCPCF